MSCLINGSCPTTRTAPFADDTRFMMSSMTKCDSVLYFSFLLWLWLPVYRSFSSNNLNIDWIGLYRWIYLFAIKRLFYFHAKIESLGATLFPIYDYNHETHFLETVLPCDPVRIFPHFFFYTQIRLQTAIRWTTIIIITRINFPI